MKTFCVAYHSSFEGVLHQRIIEAESLVDAYHTELAIQGFNVDQQTYQTPQEVEQLCMDCDSWITALELTNVKIL